MAEERDLVAAARFLVVLCGDEFHHVDALGRGPAAEAFGAAPQASEAADLRAVGAEHPDRDVDRDLVDLAEHEVVFVRVDRVADRVTGRDRPWERAVRLEFRGLGRGLLGSRQRHKCAPSEGQEAARGTAA